MNGQDRSSPDRSAMRGRGGPSGVTPTRAVITVAAALIAASLPVFLLSALAPSVQLDLGFGEAGLGIAVAAFFLAAAVSSVPGGRFADRFGAPIALRTGLAVAATGSLLVALLADSRWTLTAAMFLGGTALGFVDTGGARAIAAAVPVTRQGLAFGSKEASIPAASFLAGASVPILGAQLGWRWAFGAGVGFAVLVGTLVSPRLERSYSRVTDSMDASTDARSPAPLDEGSDRTDGGSDRTHATDMAHDEGASADAWPLVLLSVTAALGGGAAAAATAFLVTSSVTGGLASGAAGSLLAVASAVAIGARLAVGAAADRRASSAVPLVAMMLAVGGTGAIGLASAATSWLSGGLAAAVLVVGAVLAIGAGWGWTGLVFLAAVRLDPTRPAKAAGIVLVGLGIGGAVAPASFGAVAGSAGYASAWTAAACAMFTAMLTAVAAHRLAGRRA